MPAIVLLNANTEAVARPPISVTTPQLVARLQSPKNLTANRNQQKTYGSRYQARATNSNTAANPLPQRATPRRDQRRLPLAAMQVSLRIPPSSPPIAPPRSGSDE